ncbi:hypothetical protein, partial [Aquisphaera insulae]|uniref:hypothetical protein n=1 Tax=Aquisphaera insulae TaxID=2712864 RepID=UPI00196AE9A2
MDRSRIAERRGSPAPACLNAWLSGCAVALTILWAAPEAARAQTAEARHSAAPARSPSISVDTFPLE